VKSSCPSTNAAIYVRAQSRARALHAQDINVEQRACRILAIRFRRCVTSGGGDEDALYRR
jgi:hypothetical protein